ncbi:MAG: response regulator [Steroidobacter sp.]
MIDVMIVDDEAAARRVLRDCCEEEGDLRIVGEFDDSATALSAIQAQPPQLLFLDIQICANSGIDLARALDPATLPQIVFVTAYDHYALEAFEVNATDYLLKPFDNERFRNTLDRVRCRLANSNSVERQAALSTLLTQLQRGARTTPETPQRLLAEYGGSMHLLDVSQIELVESNRNYVKLIIGREVFHARSTLQQAEKALQSQSMLRISRSCLINIHHLRQVSRTPRGDFILVLAGGITVTSSEGFREAVREYLDRLKLKAGYESLE